MKKILLSLFSTSLLAFSSSFAYACNSVKKDQNEVKNDDATSVVAKNYEIYDQNFINEQIKQESKMVQNDLQGKENNCLNSEKQLETDQVFKNVVNNLSNKIVDSEEKNTDQASQQSIPALDPFTLLSQITWQFLKDAQVRELIAQIEANHLYQNLVSKIDSPVELAVLDDNNTLKNHNDYLQTKQYIICLSYVSQNSLYPKVENISFNCNVIVNQLSQKQINEQTANKYCDLIALWNQDILHLQLDEWNENFNFYIVENLIKDIKFNAKNYKLIDKPQIIDDLAVFIINNNQLVLDNKDIIENQLYNVEVKVKVGQGKDQVIKWTSFIIDFKKPSIQQKKQANLDDAIDQKEFESDLDSNNLDDLLNYTNITLEKLINSLYNKPYFKELISDLSSIITSSFIAGR